jgi:hypothetical protein
MRVHRNVLVTVAGLAGLAILGALMPSPHAEAQNPVPGSAPVNIVSPLPLPVTVTGSSTISGTVAATQSGTWNVNTKNVDERGRNPYQAVLSCSSAAGACSGSGVAVAANTRLVIEHVSAQIQVSTGKPIQFTTLNINGAVGEQSLPNHLQAVNLGNGNDQYYVNEQVLLYADAGKFPFVGVQTTSGNFVVINATLTGYIINLGI